MIMWCPNCKNEYVPGVTHCADCGVDLVETLEECAVESELSETETELPAMDMKFSASGDNETGMPEELFAKEPCETAQAHAYISGKTKTEDMKSTACTFTLVGALGLILLALFAAGILPIRMAGYMKVMMCLVMGTMFAVFLVIGLRSFSQIKACKAAADSEERLLSEILHWFGENFDQTSLDDGLDTSQPEETLYFARYEVMRRNILAKYPGIDESLLDHMIETLYAEIFA